LIWHAGQLVTETIANSRRKAGHCS
jgi:hypothetical protein